MAMDIDTELAGLHRLSVPKLRERYAEAFGEPTTGNNKPWLIRRIAWRLQERAEGGLSERAQRRARELADDADLRVIPARVGSPPNSRPSALPEPTSSDPRVPPVGSAITRTYKGKVLEVNVLADGFEYRGVIFRSLSAVAKQITGSHLNGFAFFGLTGGKR